MLIKVDSFINPNKFCTITKLCYLLQVKAMKEACGKTHMKSILAIGELGSMNNVYKASLVCMMAGYPSMAGEQGVATSVAFHVEADSSGRTEVVSPWADANPSVSDLQLVRIPPNSAAYAGKCHRRY